MRSFEALPLIVTDFATSSSLVLDPLGFQMFELISRILTIHNRSVFSIVNGAVKAQTLKFTQTRSIDEPQNGEIQGT